MRRRIEWLERRLEGEQRRSEEFRVAGNDLAARTNLAWTQWREQVARQLRARWKHEVRRAVIAEMERRQAQQ